MISSLANKIVVVVEGVRRVKDLAACVEMLSRPQTFTADSNNSLEQQQHGGQVRQQALQVERQGGIITHVTRFRLLIY